MSDILNQLAANALGVPAEAAAPAETDNASASAAASGKTGEAKTVAEEAIEKGSPQDEADAMSADAILYEVDGRKLTPSQIKGTFDRYRDLNFKHQEMADLHRVAEIAGQLGLGSNPKEIAQAFAEMLREKANAPVQQGGQQTGALPEDDELTRWEEENAAKLPPGYREIQNNLRNFGSGQQQMMELLRGVLAQAGQTSAQAAATATDARQQRATLMQERMKHNLETMASAVGLAPDHAQDFMLFAGERGYTLEDFIDAGLTKSVMTDFKNNMASPEMERLRQIAQRRQAFTGSMTSGASGGGAPAPAANGNSTLEGLISAAMAQRGG